MKYSLRAIDLSKGWVIILLFTLIGLDVVILFLNWQIDLATLHHLPGGIVLSTNVFWSLDKYSFLTSRTREITSFLISLYFFPIVWGIFLFGLFGSSVALPHSSSYIAVHPWFFFRSDSDNFLWYEAVYAKWNFVIYKVVDNICVV